MERNHTFLSVILRIRTHSKPVQHRFCRRNLGSVVQMRINIRGGREIAVSQPLLNHLHRDAVCQKQTGARVAQIVKADAPQMIIPQDDLERIGEIIRLEQIAHCVYADVVCVFFCCSTYRTACGFLSVPPARQAAFPGKPAQAARCACWILFLCHWILQELLFHPAEPL